MCVANIMMGFCLKSVQGVKSFLCVALIWQCASSNLSDCLSCNEHSTVQSLVRECNTKCTAKESVKMNSIPPAQMWLLIWTRMGQQPQIFWKSYKQTEEQLRYAAITPYTFTLHCVNNIVLQSFDMILHIKSVPFQCSDHVVLPHPASCILSTHVLSHFNPSVLAAHHTCSYCNALQQWLQWSLQELPVDTSYQLETASQDTSHIIRAHVNSTMHLMLSWNGFMWGFFGLNRLAVKIKMTLSEKDASSHAIRMPDVMCCHSNHFENSTLARLPGLL